MKVRFEILEDGSGMLTCPNPNSPNASLAHEVNKLTAEFKAGNLSYSSYLTSMKQLMSEAPDLIDLNMRYAAQSYSEGNIKGTLKLALSAVKIAHRLMPEGFSGTVEWKHPGNRAYILALKQTIVAYTALRQYKAAKAQIKLLYIRNPDDDQMSFKT